MEEAWEPCRPQMSTRERKSALGKPEWFQVCWPLASPLVHCAHGWPGQLFLEGSLGRCAELGLGFGLSA